MNQKIFEKISLSIRMLSIDAIQKANSGHPGLPMGCAEIGALIYGEVLKHFPDDPDWINRDRFVLSAGHGVMLAYSLLYLSGYNISLDQIKKFRQLGSITPGHPEHKLTPGIDVTTGILGEGISNAVGMAMAERIFSAKFNTKKYKIIDHYTYVLASDGDIMEGVASETASIAGHHKLGKLIVFYDSNRITIEGSTDLTFTEDVIQRYKAYNWHAVTGNPYDIEEMRLLINEAKKEKDKPSFILLNTTIAKGSANMSGSHQAHGAPLGEEEVKASKKFLGVPEDSMFYVDPEALSFFDEEKKEWEKNYLEWKDIFNEWKNENYGLYKEWESFTKNNFIDLKNEQFPKFEIGENIATRKASSKTLNYLAKLIPNLIGGSADLGVSTSVILNGLGNFQPETPLGRNFYFGIREHGMSSIVNGLALYGGFRVFCSTFFVFSDYMRPSIRLASLMKLPIIYIFSHDSIYVGEDGPTHQPVEHLAAIRTIIGLSVLRPADAQETVLAWKMAISNTDAPTAIILTRQKVEVFDKYDNNWETTITKGAYIVQDFEYTPDIVIIATGSEVNLAIKVKEKLANQNIRIISMISRKLFISQDNDFKDELIPVNSKKIIIEAGIAQGWEGLAGENGIIISIEEFGKSAPGQEVGKYFGFDADVIAKRIDNVAHLSLT